jgi:Fe-S-cluster-containing hydrogenase component 2
MTHSPASTVTAETLQALPIFSSLAGPAVEQILHTGRIQQLGAQQRLSRVLQRSAPARESYCFVVAGQVAVVLDRAGTVGVGPAPPGQSGKEDLEFVGSFAAGDFFSDGYLDGGLREGSVTLDCLATTSVTLLASPADTLAALMRQYTGWAAQLGQAMAASRRRFLSQQEPTRRFVQDFYLRQGLPSARRVRVSELRHCFDCNKCEEACAKRHGHPLMTRAHTHLGRLAFHQFCLNCTEQACLGACSFDAMSVDAAGEIRITDACGGCGACARKCPYGAISLVDVPYTEADFPAAVPVSGDNGATALPGLFVAGDVLGPRSTKLAIGEAKRAVDAMRPGSKSAGDGQALDAIIVGAGVAGLAAARRASERKLDFVVLEKASALSAPAARLAATARIQPAMPVLGVADGGQGLVRVDVAQGSYLARNVLVSTGQPEPGAPSVLGRAGIPMIDPGTKAMAAYVASRGMHAVGRKCDNCAGYPDRACVRACPTGSLIELAPQELFLEQSHEHGERGNFSGVAFVEGVAEHRARHKKHRTAGALFAVLVVLALAAIGLEVFLRRALPEHSVEGMVRAFLGNTKPVWYGSGRGFGHWLGYIGTGFMLSTLFYPLRTRLGFLKSWGAQSTWLNFHLWVGFIGATLVTYHAAFKLDRWVALSCYAMWIVVLSGAIGRYLYGMVHSGIGLVEFEREALRRSSASLTAQQGLGARVLRLFAGEAEKPSPIYTELFVMLWHELRDFAVLLWLRLVGLSRLPSHRARRQTLHYLADLAAHRRSRRYLESAKRLLRYWNWVHIVLTIAMFILAGFHITYGFMYKAV